MLQILSLKCHFVIFQHTGPLLRVLLGTPYIVNTNTLHDTCLATIAIGSNPWRYWSRISLSVYSTRQFLSNLLKAGEATSPCASCGIIHWKTPFFSLRVDCTRNCPCNCHIIKMYRLVQFSELTLWSHPPMNANRTGHNTGEYVPYSFWTPPNNIIICLFNRYLTI